ncbi:UNVERIFIED_CONTAM: hypothetical protein H355_000248 [Colinus virginianus]|nr:hypothetical protein H355_000248 [Colinus virginianus]
MLRAASERRRQRVELLRWYQIPLSSARIPRSGLFSSSFQYSLCSYQQLRASKHLRVGRPFLPPPLGPVDPCPPARLASPQPQSSAAARTEPHADPGALPTAPQCPVEPRSTHQRPRRARRSHAGPQRSAQQCSATAQPSSATERGPVLQQAEDTAMTSSSDSEEELTPLKELLACDEDSSHAEHGEVACLEPDPLTNSLDALLLERREQCPADAVQSDLTQVYADSGGRQEPTDDDTELLEEQRAFLSLYDMKLLTFPTTHPGEPIFHACPLPPPTLDTHGLRARSDLEQNFFRASPADQACYLSHSLLYLADIVVGTERPQGEQRGHLQQLCTQLERFGSGLREGMGQFYRSQLKNLATVLCIKWQELLE